MKILVVTYDINSPKRVSNDRIIDMKKSKSTRDKDGWTQKSVNEFKTILSDLSKGGRQVTLRVLDE